MLHWRALQRLCEHSELSEPSTATVLRTFKASVEHRGRREVSHEHRGRLLRQSDMGLIQQAAIQFAIKIS